MTRLTQAIGRFPARHLLLASALVLAPAAIRADIGGKPAATSLIRGATCVPRPGAAPILADILIRDGKIVRVGKGLPAPAGARIYDLPGRYVYAGVVDLDLQPKAAKSAAAKGEPSSDTAKKQEMRSPSWANPVIRSDRVAADALPTLGEWLKTRRSAGVTSGLLLPGDGVFRGIASVVALGDAKAEHSIRDRRLGQVMAFQHGDWGDKAYPNSLMGAIALSRQTLLDTGWQERAMSLYRKAPHEILRPPVSAKLEALRGIVHGRQPVVMQSEDVRMMPRLLKVAREFRLRPIVVQAGSDLYRRPKDVKRWLDRAGGRLVIRLDYPEPPEIQDDVQATAIETDLLLAWDRAPSNPAILAGSGIPFAVTTAGLDNPGDLWERLRHAIARGLPPRTALAALTTEPARILHREADVGTVEPGKIADLLVATGPLFDAGTEIEETWIDGARYGDPWRQALRKDVLGEFRLEVTGSEPVRIRIREEEGELKASIVAKTKERTKENLLTVAFSGGTLTLALPASAGGGMADLRRRGKLFTGETALGGKPVRLTKAAVKETFTPPVSLGAATWPPVAGPSDNPPAVLVRGATILTAGPSGRLEAADLLVVDGHVQAVGKSLAAPANALVIEGSGKVVTPGLIDCHSHSAIAGGVNEATQSSTAEVRIEDVIDADAPSIYRQLAGGLTASHQLHGSANPIGGQDAVIKLRWGEPAERLLYQHAHPGIKFALGENVKQSNWGEKFTTRYPQTRMGVEQFMLDRFLAARDAAAARRRFAAKPEGAVPRRDLELEALDEVLAGKRYVHCHAYRADEILMLMRLAERLGFRVKTFQHVLEGYKAADEMAQHGAGGSTFSDWWAYKYEVIDAIPYNATLMQRRGVLVSLNSDSQELGRRLATEAGKAVKYGRMDRVAALKLVTLNPAKQLGIDRYVGSLEPGKEGDFVIWSDDPLSGRAVCLETWVDGVRRFSREKDRKARKAAASLRTRLIMALKAPKAGLPKKDGTGAQPTAGRYGRTLDEAGISMATGLCRLGVSAP